MLARRLRQTRVSARLAKYKGAELRKVLGDAGVRCESSHFGIKELRDNLPDRIAWAKESA